MTLALHHGLALLVSLALAVSGCSQQGEGDRCSVANGSSDCEAPLVCTRRELLTGSTVDRCCPADRAKATTTECSVTFTGSVDAGTSPTEPLVDAGTARADASTADGGTTTVDASIAADARSDAN
jgi:hypothetical protein